MINKYLTIFAKSEIGSTIIWLIVAITLFIGLLYHDEFYAVIGFGLATAYLAFSVPEALSEAIQKGEDKKKI